VKKKSEEKNGKFILKRLMQSIQAGQGVSVVLLCCFGGAGYAGVTGVTGVRVVMPFPSGHSYSQSCPQKLYWMKAKHCWSLQEHTNNHARLTQSAHIIIKVVLSAQM